MIETSCHCGAVKLFVKDDAPKSLTSCNCSLCKRYGCLLAYFPESRVTFEFSPDSVVRYTWGDKCIELVHCNQCGCFSHWKDIREEKADRMGVNARLFANVDFEKIPIRLYDGAKTWQYLD